MVWCTVQKVAQNWVIRNWAEKMERFLYFALFHPTIDRTYFYLMVIFYLQQLGINCNDQLMLEPSLSMYGLACCMNPAILNAVLACPQVRSDPHQLYDVVFTPKDVPILPNSVVVSHPRAATLVWAWEGIIKKRYDCDIKISMNVFFSEDKTKVKTKLKGTEMQRILHIFQTAWAVWQYNRLPL